MSNRKTWIAALVLLASVGIAGCDGDDGEPGPRGAQGPQGPQGPGGLQGEPGPAPGSDLFTLQLLHLADMDGSPTALDNVEGLSALVSAFRAEFPSNTLVVSSGDNYIPGPRYFAADDASLDAVIGVAGNGRGDIGMVNALGVQASAVGNHDLDEGTEAFAGIISPDGAYPGAAFPYLSANLDFSTDPNLSSLVAADGQPAATIAGQLAGTTTATIDGETIGIVGATTPELGSITSSGGITVNPGSGATSDLAAVIQASVDSLADQGIDKIILLAHMQQLSVERELATLLQGVDIIVAGGSNTLLADITDTLRAGDSVADTYPLVRTSAAGEPVLVVNVDGDYKYLGRVVVGFDASGVIDLGSLDAVANGAFASTDDVVSRTGAAGQQIPRVTEVAGALRAVLVARDGNIQGQTSVYLDGRRGEVRTEETNLGNLTADANLWYANLTTESVDIALKNGGGIRADIGEVIVPPGSNDPADTQFVPPQANPTAGKAEGDISQFDIEGTLRFNNGLTLLTVTAAELHEIMEHAVSATAPGATPGQFPQIGGMRIEFDPNAPARTGGDAIGDFTAFGSRIRTLEILDDAGTPENPADDTVADTVVSDGLPQGDPARTFRMVTLNFLASCVGSGNVTADANCGDGYPFKNLTAPGRADLTIAADFDPLSFDPGLADFSPTGGEQDALAEFLAAFFPAGGAASFDIAETAPADDTRIANQDPAGLD